MDHKYFPIKQGIACQSKWVWSSIFLNWGISRSCHRASESSLTAETFNNFHNTEEKTRDRKLMLDGTWPTGGCEYCQKIEESGGFSDRMLHNQIPDLFPSDIITNETVTTPTILEIFFDNTCNLSCLYCAPEISSKIAEEYKRFGDFDSYDVKLISQKEKQIKTLEPEFWKWMHHNFHTLKRFHFLGGEPFLQKELDALIEFINLHPNPQCELNIVTNLMVTNNRLKNYIEQFKELIDNQKIKRLDITASIDCWGPEQEYVRYGIDLAQWKENFEYLIDNEWIVLNINQTITSLTTKSMPKLLELLSNWKKIRQIGHYFSVSEPGPSWMRPDIFGPGVFDIDFKLILSSMNSDTEEERTAVKYMSGIANQIEMSKKNIVELKKLLVFLNEKDRRRGTNWRKTFPWLEEELKDVV